MPHGVRPTVLVMLILCAAMLTQTGCGGMSAIKDEAIGVMKPPMPEVVAPSMDTPDPAKGSPFDPEAPLAGTWTFKGMVATGSGSDVTWSVSPNTGELIIARTATGYSLAISEGTSLATLDGDTVVLERNFPAQNVSVRYTGTLSGDTITGTQHSVINGASHDDPWTATRVK